MQLLTENTLRQRHGFGRRSSQGLLREFIARLRRFQTAQRDYKMLKHAPDHVLEDVGLSREDVESAEAELHRLRMWAGLQ